MRGWWGVEFTLPRSLSELASCSGQASINSAAAGPPVTAGKAFGPKRVSSLIAITNPTVPAAGFLAVALYMVGLEIHEEF